MKLESKYDKKTKSYSLHVTFTETENTTFWSRVAEFSGKGDGDETETLQAFIGPRAAIREYRAEQNAELTPEDFDRAKIAGAVYRREKQKQQATRTEN